MHLDQPRSQLLQSIWARERAHAQDLPPLEPGADDSAAAISSDWLADDHQVYVLRDLVNGLDLSAILGPAEAKDPLP